MRIALVTEFYYPTLGGVQEHVYHLGRECERLGHEVAVITSRVDAADGLLPSHAEHNVHLIGRSLAVQMNGSVGRVSVGWSLAEKLRALLTKEHFDVVHVHAPLTPVLPMLALRQTALPLVGTFHTNFARSRLLGLARPAVQRLIDRIDVNVAVSGACVHALAPYVKARYRLIPNGVDCRAFAEGRALESLRGERPVVLFIGRLEQRSGLPRLLRAFPDIHKRSNARLVVIGEGPDRRANEALARELGVDAHFAGARHSDRADWFKSADVLVCPTTIASFGITLLEGMAAGLPVVASDIDGFREVLTHGREGFLVDTSRPERLSDAVATLLEHPALARRLGEAGQHTARAYDWPVVAKKVAAVYEEVAGGR